MASSSNDPDSLVTLRFHDFRVERMRHWWTLLGEDDHADIVGIFGKFPPFMRLQVDRGLLEALASFWDPTHCCFSIGEVDLIPTMEEYAELLQLDSPFSETPVIPIQGPRSNRCLEKYLGLTTAVLRPEIARPEETWRKANISLDLLTKRQGEGVPMFCTQLLQLWFCSHLQHFHRLQTPYHFERHTVSQTVQIALPFTGDSRAWALYLLDLPLSGWAWKVTWGPAAWMPWTHCALFDGVPLPGVWGCTGHYPSLALRQFSGVQYPPRLGDLDAPPLVSLREVTVLERELEEAQTELLSLRLARASEREASAARVESLRSTLHHNSVAVANLRRDLVAQRGNVSTLRTMNEFIREQLEISEDAKEQLEETLAEAREQLETEQAERTRVQDELDSLRSYTQALVDPATGRPQDIVALRRALDASEEALTPSWILVHDALESNASWLNQEGFPVVTSLHQINQVMDSLGTRARAVWEEHDEGDPALSTALGRFCRETCIRLGH
uniref:DUF7745 domain-containing protein n=1 Tax=Fagus sylvatica TaxID=28930 RepID=A0A2N9GT30_FAGSY